MGKSDANFRDPKTRGRVKIKVDKKVRLTVSDLKYYVPKFHEAVEAKKILQQDEESDSPKLSFVEKTRLEVVSWGEQQVVLKIAELCGPLLTTQINKLLSKSHLRFREDSFDILYYATTDGIVKGLSHFKSDKIKNSATNYLFQWIMSSVKRELHILETSNR